MERKDCVIGVDVSVIVELIARIFAYLEILYTVPKFSCLLNFTNHEILNYCEWHIQKLLLSSYTAKTCTI